MAWQKGKPKDPNSGRRRGSLNKPNAEIRDILLYHKDELITIAVQMAREGNATVLCKLLDKILPSLNSNNNINESKMTLEDYIISRKFKDEQRN